jgi:hypothetical protein
VESHANARDDPRPIVFSLRFSLSGLRKPVLILPYLSCATLFPRAPAPGPLRGVMRLVRRTPCSSSLSWHIARWNCSSSSRSCSSCRRRNSTFFRGQAAHIHSESMGSFRGARTSLAPNRAVATVAYHFSHATCGRSSLVTVSSLVSQRDHRIDFRRAAGRNEAGEKRHADKNQRHGDERQWIGWLDAEKEAGQETCE